MQHISLSAQRNGVSYPLTGRLAQGFEPLAQAFARNFCFDEDEGASCAAFVNGELVADLWGGYSDVARTAQWQDNTLVCTMSAGKAVAATAIALLCERGLLDLDAPVARYWPEFAQRGKEHVALRWVLDHRAGLPALTRLDPPPGALHDWQWMTSTLAGQAPEWQPGEAAGYHILTQGYILGEVVRRVAGVSLNEFVQRELCEPLGADFHFGVPRHDLRRCADILPMTNPQGTLFDRKAIPRESLLGRGMVNLLEGEDFNTVAWRTSEISSANGHCTARGLATFYAMLSDAGALNGLRLLSQATVLRMVAVQHTLVERVMNRGYNQALGLLRSTYPVTWFGPNPNSFGHHGVGGSVGFADPDRHIGFAYATAKFHSRLDTGTRSRRMAETLYACLDEQGR
jgi:CubicO group peptidase (beta-lactamase class C family)